MAEENNTAGFSTQSILPIPVLEEGPVEKIPRAEPDMRMVWQKGKVPERGQDSRSYNRNDRWRITYKPKQLATIM